jgi:hypothetical protein
MRLGSRRGIQHESKESKAQAWLQLWDDDTIICRRLILNTLVQEGPCPVELLITEANKQCGFSRAEVLEAARHWNFTTEERDGLLGLSLRA